MEYISINILSMIPKNIYQTWKTHNLHPKIQKLRNNILKNNPEYSLILYNDQQMVDFVNSNYDSEIKSLFNKINNIVSKADFWRYLVLYKLGGVYLDIDSTIDRNLNLLIQNNDSAVVTAEKNHNCFVQWALIFEKNHPILEKTIENLIANMKNKKYKNDVLNFSVKPYWDAVNDFLRNTNSNLSWSLINENTDIVIDSKNIRTRFYSIDYGAYFQFKHKYNHLLRSGTKGMLDEKHWTITQFETDIY